MAPIKETMAFYFCLLFLLLFPGWGRADSSKQEITELRNLQQGQAEVLAESRQEVEALRREIQELKGMLDEIRHFFQQESERFQQESEKQRKILQDFDFRLIGLEERLSLHQRQLEELFTRPQKKKQGKETAVTEAAVEEEAAYKQALAAVNLGNSLEAIKLFDDFLKKYPQSSLADNAQYWKGESFYANKDFAAALLEFEKVIKGYPKSEKIPAALLKQGYCLYEKKTYEEAKIFLKKVVDEHPKSDEAAEAKERIQMIEKNLTKSP